MVLKFAFLPRFCVNGKLAWGRTPTGAADRVTPAGQKGDNIRQYDRKVFPSVQRHQSPFPVQPGSPGLQKFARPMVDLAHSRLGMGFEHRVSCSALSLPFRSQTQWPGPGNPDLSDLGWINKGRLMSCAPNGRGGPGDPG